MSERKRRKTTGQFFTTSSILTDCVQNFVKNNPTKFLEPSCGEGHLVKAVLDKHPGAVFVGCELDPDLKFNSNPNVITGDFLKQPFEEKFKTIVGNPPFVKTGSTNLFLQFTDRCVDLLNDGGELVFIVPSDIFYMTSGKKLMEKMWAGGTFTDVFKPNKENLFENATVDVVVFRYELGNFERQMNFNGEERFVHNHNGVISFHNNSQNNSKTFEDFFNVYVGFVTGAEPIMKNDLGNCPIINGKNSSNNYLMIDKWDDATEEQKAYLSEHKEKLINRKIRKFDEDNWFQFGLMRNKKHIDEYLGKPCIYLKMITRSKEVAWIGNVGYFGGSILCIIPKNNHTDLQEVVDYLNGDEFRFHWTASGRFRITHRVLSNSVCVCD